MQHADVLVSRVPLPHPFALRRVERLLAGHPGCLVAAVPDTAWTSIVGIRDRANHVRYLRLERGFSGVSCPPHAVVAVPAVASVVHAWAAFGAVSGVLRRVIAAATVRL
jgi:hypothetical protein